MAKASIDIEPVEKAPQSVTPEAENSITPETIAEQSERLVLSPEKKDNELINKIKKVIAKNDQPSASVAAAPQIKSDTRKKVEEIMQKGLVDIYKTMTPEEQTNFKEKGNETAGRIEILIETVKAKAKYVLELIRGWLSLIPRANSFFLEQESKLKTDQIIAYSKERKKQLALKNKNQI